MGRSAGTVRLKGLNASGRWPSGNVRYYYRPAGQKGIAMPDLPKDHPDFLAAYARARSATPMRSDKAVAHGSLSAAILA